MAYKLAVLEILRNLYYHILSVHAILTYSIYRLYDIQSEILKSCTDTWTGDTIARQKQLSYKSDNFGSNPLFQKSGSKSTRSTEIPLVV